MKYIRLLGVVAALAVLVTSCGSTDTSEAGTITPEVSSSTTEANPGTSEANNGVSTSVHGDCPSGTFLSVSDFDGPGGDYPDPELTVTCDDDLMTVATNNIPHYAFVAITPNDLTAQEDVYTIPLDPVYAEEATAAPLLGSIAVAVNGGSINGPSEAGIPVDQAFGDPVYNGILDACLGHVGMSYHFHALVETCLATSVDTAAASPVLGWSIDGFAIHGGRGCLDSGCTEVVIFVSGYEQIGDPTTYATDAYEYVTSDDPLVLDECNGRLGADGIYRYHTTATYPYILGCYHGVVTGTAPTGGPGGP